MKNLLLCSLLMLTLPAWAAEAPLSTSVSAYVKLQGAPKNVRSMMDSLENEDAYKAAGCLTTPASKSGNVAGMSCSKPDSALMDTLNRLAPRGVKWNMSAQACATGCVMMACPTIGYPITCCKKTTTGYKPCVAR